MVAFQNPEDFREVTSMFQRSRVILTGFELGIFTIIGDRAKTSEEVAAEANTNPRATDRLMNALVVCELLEKQNGLFRNAEFSSKFLVKGKPGYLAGFGHSVNMWWSWSQLTDAVRKGHTLRREEDRDSRWRDSFIAAMHDRGMRQAPAVIAKLDLKNVNRILDVGGGSGAYTFAFVKAKPGLKAVIFDLPDILPITEKYIKAEAMENNVSTMPGDYLTDDLGTGYDLIFLSAIVHINSYKENEALIRRCAHALNPGGRVVMQDHVMDEERTSPAAGVLFALNMLVGTHRGDTYTETEMHEWLTNAGLTDFKRIETFNNAMIIGCKK